MRPGLLSELEYELRQYTRRNKNRLYTNNLEEVLQASDRYGTGKLLKSQVIIVEYCLTWYCHQYYFTFIFYYVLLFKGTKFWHELNLADLAVFVSIEDRDLAIC